MIQIELSPRERDLIYESLVKMNNNIVHEIELRKKKKIKFGLNQLEKDLKDVRKITHFFEGV